MWKRNHPRPVGAPCLYTVCESYTRLTEMIRLRVLSDRQGDLKMAELPEELFAPGRRTFVAGRKVSRFACPREAEAHRQNRDLRRVVKLLACDAQPLTQAISAGVAERHTGGMHLAAQRLSRNQNSCLRVQLDLTCPPLVGCSGC